MMAIFFSYLPDVSTVTHLVLFYAPYSVNSRDCYIWNFQDLSSFLNQYTNMLKLVHQAVATLPRLKSQRSHRFSGFMKLHLGMKEFVNVYTNIPVRMVKRHQMHREPKQYKAGASTTLGIFFCCCFLTLLVFLFICFVYTPLLLSFMYLATLISRAKANCNLV